MIRSKDSAMFICTTTIPFWRIIPVNLVPNFINKQQIIVELNKSLNRNLMDMQNSNLSSIKKQLVTNLRDIKYLPSVISNQIFILQNIKTNLTVALRYWYPDDPPLPDFVPSILCTNNTWFARKKEIFVKEKCQQKNGTFTQTRSLATYWDLEQT